MTRIAVVGFGSVGKRHVENLLLENGENILVHDPVPAAFTTDFDSRGVRFFARLDDVWAECPEIVFVTGPTQTHTAVALEAARRGCDIFIEKPLAHAETDLDSLISIAEDRKLVTMVGCNMRFHPGPARVKALLDARAIGRVLSARIETGSFLPRWRPHQDYRQSYSGSKDWGGAVLDCIHELDLACWYFGSAKLLAAVVRPAASIGLETDGLAEILLHHDDTISSVHLNFVERDYHRACRILGEKGTLVWDFYEGIRLFDEAGELMKTEPASGAEAVNEMYREELRHFLAAVGRRRPAMNSLREARDTLRLALEIRKRGAR